MAENDDPPRASSISCGVAPRVAGEAPDMAASGGSQEEKQDEPAIVDVDSLDVGFVEPSCHDVAVDGNQGDLIGSTSSDNNQDSGHGETAWCREAHDRHGRSQDAGTNKSGSSFSGQLTTCCTRGRLSPEMQAADNPSATKIWRSEPKECVFLRFVVSTKRLSGVAESMVMISRVSGSMLFVFVSLIYTSSYISRVAHYAKAKLTCVKPSTGMALGGNDLHDRLADHAS